MRNIFISSIPDKITFYGLSARLPDIILYRRIVPDLIGASYLTDSMRIINVPLDRIIVL